MRYALRSAFRFAGAPAWHGFIVGKGGAFARVNVSSDAALDAWAREQATTVWHPTGTARMGPCGAAVGEGSVVNPDLTVKGVLGLRIVDASILVSGVGADLLFAFSGLTASLRHSTR